MPTIGIGVAVTDLFTGVLTSNAILAALSEVEKTGKGTGISALNMTAIISFFFSFENSHN